MSSDAGRLGEAWRLRNAAAQTLALGEEQVRAAIRAASVEELVALIDTFSPARSSGPEWTRTFEPLVERLWTWRDDATMASLAATFKARGVAWAMVATALSAEHGARLRGSLQHPAWAKLPSFSVA